MDYLGWSLDYRLLLGEETKNGQASKGSQDSPSIESPRKGTILGDAITGMCGIVLFWDLDSVYP